MDIEPLLKQDLDKFHQNYKKLRKYAIADDVQDEKEGRAMLKMLDALDSILLELTSLVLRHEEIYRNSKK